MVDRLFRFSQTSTFMQSRSKYLIQYVYGLQKKYPEGPRPCLASDVGTIGHKGLEAVYKGHSVAVAERAMKMLTHSLNVYETDKAKPQDAFDAFARHYAWLQESKVDEGYETVAVEDRLYLDLGEILGDHIVLTGAPDLVQRDRFGSLFIRDWKFVAQYGPLSGFVDANRQGLTYALMVQEKYGQAPIRFDLRQTSRKPPKRATTAFVVAEVATQWLKPESLERHEVQLRRTIEDMVRLHQEVEAGDLSGAYGNPSMNCSMMCSFYDVCCGGIAKPAEQIAEILSTEYEPKREQL